MPPTPSTRSSRHLPCRVIPTRAWARSTALSLAPLILRRDGIRSPGCPATGARAPSTPDRQRSVTFHVLRPLSGPVRVVVPTGHDRLRVPRAAPPSQKRRLRVERDED